MAKEKMNCPFTNRLCEECALYRGRHYYLCYYKKYRGYLGNPGESAEGDSTPTAVGRSKGIFEIPEFTHHSAIDPFVTKDEERQEEEV